MELERYLNSLIIIFICCVVLLFQSCSKSSFSEWIEGFSQDNRILRFNPPSEYDSLMFALKPTMAPNVVSLLWFTDVHRNHTNLRRLLLWYNHYRDCFDDILSTGDQQDSFFTDSFGWWDENDAGRVLLTIGNHDSWISKTMYEEGNYEGTIISSYGKAAPFWILSQKDTYDKYISSFIKGWDVIQPESSSDYGKCYYYKDYDNLRLIVLDCMHYGTEDDLDENKDSRQDKWFRMLLDDACDKKIPVVAVSHFAPGYTTPISCSYSYKSTTGKYSDRLNSSAYKRVKAFIDKGGEFVCWLAGHIHVDVIGTLDADIRQPVIICATANEQRSTKIPRFKGSKMQDSFNCISFDTEHKQINIVKVGADLNEDNERKRVVRYNYSDYVDNEGNTHKRGLVCSY